MKLIADWRPSSMSNVSDTRHMATACSAIQWVDSQSSVAYTATIFQCTHHHHLCPVMVGAHQTLCQTTRPLTCSRHTLMDKYTRMNSSETDWQLVRRLRRHDVTLTHLTRSSNSCEPHSANVIDTSHHNHQRLAVRQRKSDDTDCDRKRCVRYSSSTADSTS